MMFGRRKYDNAPDIRGDDKKKKPQTNDEIKEENEREKKRIREELKRRSTLEVHPGDLP